MFRGRRPDKKRVHEVKDPERWGKVWRFSATLTLSAREAQEGKQQGAMDYMYGARELAMQRFLRKVLFNSTIAERLYTYMK